MKMNPDQPILTRKERLKLASLVRRQNKELRKQNPTGRVVGISRIPNSTEIQEFFAEISKKRQSKATGATAANSSTGAPT